MDGPTIDSLIPVWAQAGLAVGAVVGGILITIFRSAKSATPELSTSRSEFMEVFLRETQANREILQTMKHTGEATRDTAAAIRDLIGRSVTSQEAIVKLMESQAEDARFVERTQRMLGQISDRERDRDDAQRRADDHRRPNKE